MYFPELSILQLHVEREILIMPACTEKPAIGAEFSAIVLRRLSAAAEKIHHLSTGVIG